MSVDGGAGGEVWGSSGKDGVKSEWNLTALIKIVSLRARINLPREVRGNLSSFAFLGLKYWETYSVSMCRKPLEIGF